MKIGRLLIKFSEEMFYWFLSICILSLYAAPYIAIAVGIYAVINFFFMK